MMNESAPDLITHTSAHLSGEDVEQYLFIDIGAHECCMSLCDVSHRFCESKTLISLNGYGGKAIDESLLQFCVSQFRTQWMEKYKVSKIEPNGLRCERMRKLLVFVMLSCSAFFDWFLVPFCVVGIAHLACLESVSYRFFRSNHVLVRIEDITNNPIAMQRLRLACEHAKCELTDNVEALIECPLLHDEVDFLYKLTRTQFQLVCLVPICEMCLLWCCWLLRLRPPFALTHFYHCCFCPWCARFLCLFSDSLSHFSLFCHFIFNVGC